MKKFLPLQNVTHCQFISFSTCRPSRAVYIGTNYSFRTFHSYQKHNYSTGWMYQPTKVEKYLLVLVCTAVATLYLYQEFKFRNIPLSSIALPSFIRGLHAKQKADELISTLEMSPDSSVSSSSTLSSRPILLTSSGAENKNIRELQCKSENELRTCLLLTERENNKKGSVLVLRQLSELYVSMDKPVEAKTNALRCLSILVELNGQEDSSLVTPCLLLADIYSQLKQYNDAFGVLYRCKEIAAISLEPEHYVHAIVCEHLANLSREVSDYSMALRWGNDALVLASRELSPNHPQMLTMMLAFSSDLFQLHRIDSKNAEELFSKSIRLANNVQQLSYQNLKSAMSSDYSFANKTVSANLDAPLNYSLYESALNFLQDKFNMIFKTKVHHINSSRFLLIAALHNLACMEEYRGFSDKSRTHFEQARDLCRIQFGNSIETETWIQHSIQKFKK